MRFHAALLVICALITGCQRDPFAGDYTTSTPREEDVVGVYSFTRETVTWGKSAQIKDCRIELRGDGTFVALNVPREEFPGRGEDYFSDLVSTSGTWRMDPVGGVDSGLGKIKTHWGLHFTSPNESVHTAGFTGKRSPYGLILGFGDPDSGKAVFLEKH